MNNNAAKMLKTLNGLASLREHVMKRALDKPHRYTLNRWIRDHIDGTKENELVELVAKEILVERGVLPYALPMDVAEAEAA